MSGRIWKEVARAASDWRGLGYDHCASGAVLISGLDGAAHSLHERAGRTLRAGPVADEAAEPEPPRRSFFARLTR